MSITIEGTEHIFQRTTAAKFIREHVVIKKAALTKIKALAKKHGIFKELKALGIEIHPLGKGKW